VEFVSAPFVCLQLGCNSESACRPSVESLSPFRNSFASGRRGARGRPLGESAHGCVYRPRPPESGPADGSGGMRHRRNVMICQRCGSGRCANDGMPRRNDPLRKIQNSTPGGAAYTSGCRSRGAFPIPSRFAPWQAAHSRAYNLAPARLADSLPSSGLLEFAAVIGTRWTRLPAIPATPANAQSPA